MEKIGKKGCQNKGKFLFLQNGMGHLQLLRKLPAHEIYIGSVEHGAYREGANMVHHNGKGVTRIAVFKGSIEFLNSFQAKIPRLRFLSFLNQTIIRCWSEKLIVNAAINPLTAILQVRNGELIENPHYNDILQGVFSELMSILKLENKDELYNHVEAVCKNTAQNRSSMLKDLENNQPTEVDAILGYLLEEAENNLIDAPLIRTFYHLVKGKEFKKGDELND